jgi:hypothetical protein
MAMARRHGGLTSIPALSVKRAVADVMVECSSLNSFHLLEAGSAALSPFAPKPIRFRNPYPVVLCFPKEFPEDFALPSAARNRRANRYIRNLIALKPIAK